MAEEVIGITMEERLAALEKEVALLKMRLDQLTSPKGDWITKLSGSMKDIPEDVWREFMECCAEVKREGRPPDDEP
jgi:hypothetical protein